MSYIFDFYHNAQEPAYRSIFFESDSPIPTPCSIRAVGGLTRVRST